MMVITHILAGGLLGALIGPSFVFAGLLGGFVPDLDLLKGQHRKTLHYPYYYSFATVSALVSFMFTSNQFWLQITIFFAAASLHSLSDVLGGGLEPRPWEETDHRGVYSHLQQKWLKSHHIFYDGSPGDFMLSAIFAAALFLTGFQHPIVAALIGVAGFYTLVRKKIPDYFTIKPSIQMRRKTRELISSVFKSQ